MRPRAPSTGGIRTPAGAGQTRPRGRRWARPGLPGTRPAPGRPGRRRVRRRVRAWHRGWPPGPPGRRRRPGQGSASGHPGPGARARRTGPGWGKGPSWRAGSWPVAPSPESPGFVSAHWLPLSLAAICCPVACPGGRAPGTWPSMGQRSPVRGVKPTSTRPPGLNSMVIVLVGHRLQVGDGRLLLGRRRVGLRDGWSHDRRLDGDGSGHRQEPGQQDRDEQRGGEGGAATGEGGIRAWRSSSGSSGVARSRRHEACRVLRSVERRTGGRTSTIGLAVKRAHRPMVPVGPSTVGSGAVRCGRRQWSGRYRYDAWARPPSSRADTRSLSVPVLLDFSVTVMR